MGAITSVAALLAAVSTASAKANEIIWFRGQRSAAWNVEPSIWRDYDSIAERNFTNRFCTRAPTRYPDSPDYRDPAGWLSLMQHYGVPTRLLDWSRSPLIAAYFAVEFHIYDRTAAMEDAAIWVLKPHELNRQELGVDITPSINARMCRDTIDAAFTDRKPETGKVIAAMASERDLRMFVQQGCFTVHSDPRPLNLRSGSDTYIEQLVIPASSIPDLAREIDTCGFRKGDIYPDLGNLAAELKAFSRKKTP